jgi:hypothetical protein
VSPSGQVFRLRLKKGIITYFFPELPERFISGPAWLEYLKGLGYLSILIVLPQVFIEFTNFMSTFSPSRFRQALLLFLLNID